MAGYKGYSMSNNAVEAYSEGRKPLSKWTKADIVSAIKDEYGTEKADLFRGLKLAELKKVLRSGEWHHTSSYYNRTNFYELDYNFIESVETANDLACLKEYSQPKKAEKPTEPTYYANFEYLTWEGTRNHPKAVEHILYNVKVVEHGQFYIAYDENGREILRKKMFSNGTRVTRIKNN